MKKEISFGRLKFHREPMNRRVLWALIPCLLASVYYFGWRSLALIIWTNIIGLIAEAIFCENRKEAISESVFVTSTIFALIMPPSIAWHVSAIGIIFAVVMSKQVFGGFGKNIFNPAMAGRCFVYICFPVALTAVWAPVSKEKFGAFDRWSTVDSSDSICGATPMADIKAGRIVLSKSENASTEIPFAPKAETVIDVSKKNFIYAQLIGRISGTMGTTSVLAILVGGIYLFVTKTASRTIIISTILSYALSTQIFHYLGISPVPDALTTLTGGGFLFGAFFMATDPISSPKTEEAKAIYGIIIGIFTMIIRNFSIFNGGLMFAILIGNMFAPILDFSVKELKIKYKKGKFAEDSNA